VGEEVGDPVDAREGDGVDVFLKRVVRVVGQPIASPQDADHIAQRALTSAVWGYLYLVEFLLTQSEWVIYQAVCGASPSRVTGEQLINKCTILYLQWNAP
jgi:hypothetical protein